MRLTAWQRALLALVVVLPALFLLPLAIKACQGPRPDPHLASDEDAVWALAGARDRLQRFYALGPAARVALKRHRDQEARVLARELLDKAAAYRDDWNYGNAIHHAHVVFGTLALRAGDASTAGRHLLEAGRTPGSPQLDTFGPNMSLARDLLGQGEREVVLDYLELCRAFWKMGGGRLAAWARAIQAGDAPDFGVQLTH